MTRIRSGMARAVRLLRNRIAVVRLPRIPHSLAPMPLPPRHVAPSALHAPAVAEFRAARAPVGASRWHVTYCTTHRRHITARTTPDGAPCCHVTPTHPGFLYAAKLADALNRAYGIDPVEGYDVVAVLGSLRPATLAPTSAAAR